MSDVISRGLCRSP